MKLMLALQPEKHANWYSRFSIRHLVIKPSPVATTVLALALSIQVRPTEHIQSPPAIHGISLGGIYGGISESEYQIQWQSNVSSYQAPNRANNLRFTFSNDAVTAELRDKSHGIKDSPPDNWHVTISVDSFGAELGRTQPHSSAAEVSGNTAKFDGGQIAYEFVNDKAGLHQSYVIKDRSPEWGADDLVVDLRVETSGDIDLALDSSGAFVSFFKRNGAGSVMRYADLQVFDATGTELPSHMEVDSRRHILLVIDDSLAQYPLLVDPWTFGETVSLSTAQSYANFGFSVAYMERYVAADGQYYGTVIIGAPYYDDGITDQGKVFVYYGSSSGLASSPSWMAKGDASQSYFGWSVAAADPFDTGDPGTTLNDDSYADLVVGEPEYGHDKGRVFVWYGDSNGLGTSYRAADKTYTAASDFELMGTSVSTGDVTRDGYIDVIVGAPSVTSYGKVYLFKGSSTGLPSTPSQTINGPTLQFGYSVAYAHSVVSGERNVLIGAPNSETVYLYSGTTGGLGTTPSWSATGTPYSGAKFGFSVWGSRHMDVDDDGLNDIVVGEPCYDGPSTTDEGRVHVFRGFSVSGGTYSAASHDTLQDPSHQSGAYLGYSVGGGDCNQDDNGDILAGAPYYDTNASDNKGRVFIFYGRLGNSPNPTPDQLTSGNNLLTGEHFGSSIAFILKITGPGDLPCFIAGAPGADLNSVTDTGMATVYIYSH